MIDPREKMVFAAGARQRGAELAITERTAKRRGSAYDPQHQQREPGLDVRELKTKAREDTRADDVRDHKSARGQKTNRPRRFTCLRSNELSNPGHGKLDNLEITRARE